MPRITLLSAITAAMLFSTANAAPVSFFEDLSGNWSGSGEAYIKKTGDISAKCRLSVSEGKNSVAMDGTCGFLVFRKKLGLNLKSAGGNRFVGTYTGSKTGPARLDGSVKGDRLVMNITWRAPVNGDRKAQMILERTGPNSFAQTVNDEVEGETRRTSRFSFKRN